MQIKPRHMHVDNAGFVYHHYCECPSNVSHMHTCSFDWTLEPAQCILYDDVLGTLARMHKCLILQNKQHRGDVLLLVQHYTSYARWHVDGRLWCLTTMCEMMFERRAALP